MVLAFQADLTRICTFMLANEGSNRPYSLIGIPEGHHDLSHHEFKAEKQEKIRQINLFHAKQVAYILEKDYGVVLPRKLQMEFSKVVQRIADSEGTELTAFGPPAEEDRENQRYQNRLQNHPRRAYNRLLVANFETAPHQKIEHFALRP